MGLENGTPIKIWGPPWRYGRILWKWCDSDLIAVQFNGQMVANCKTFHAHDRRWKLTILSHVKPDKQGCIAPPSLTMAKPIDVTLNYAKINLVSSDDSSENEPIIAPKVKHIEIKKEIAIAQPIKKRKKKKKKIED